MSNKKLQIKLIMNKYEEQRALIDELSKLATEFDIPIILGKQNENSEIADIIKQIRKHIEAKANKATPSARWRENGELDPHGTHFDCERHELAHGEMTDDELANEVFLKNYDIAILQAGKDRIRWLSRRCEKLEKSEQQIKAEAIEEFKNWYKENHGIASGQVKYAAEKYIHIVINNETEEIQSKPNISDNPCSEIQIHPLIKSMLGD